VLPAGSASHEPGRSSARPGNAVYLAYLPERVADGQALGRDLPGPGRGPDPQPLAERCWLEEREWTAAFSLESDHGQDPREREARRRKAARRAEKNRARLARRGSQRRRREAFRYVAGFRLFEASHPLTFLYSLELTGNFSSASRQAIMASSI